MQVIGQTYITESGATELDIELADERYMTVTVGFSQNVANGVSFDWGDGTEVETVSGTGTLSLAHTYATLGKYTLSMQAVGGCDLNLFTGNGNVFGTTQAYRNILRHVRIGKNFNSEIHWGAFANSYLLKTVTIPLGVTTTSGSWGGFRGVFNSCYNLRAVVFPTGSTGPNHDSSFQYAGSCVYISIPKSCTKIGWSSCSNCRSLKVACIPENCVTINVSNGASFSECYSLKKISIGNGGTLIGGLFYCRSLQTLTIPPSIQTIYGNAFQNLTSLLTLRFQPESPPTVANSNAFQNLPTGCVIYVPAGTLEDYKAATNYPDPTVYTYVEESDG